MIICQCNLISEKEIEATIVSILEQDPWQLIVPLQVYHAMKKRGRCCGCFPNVVDIIVRVTADFHKRLNTPTSEIVSFVDRLAQINAERERERREARERLRRMRAA